MSGWNEAVAVLVCKSRFVEKIKIPNPRLKVGKSVILW
jgi:hypothetical protein